MSLCSKLKRQFRAGEPSLGTWLQIGNPATGDILAHAGFDWVCVDLEHAVIGLETLANIFGAIERHGAAPLARLPYCDPIWIKRVLDAGAVGIVAPMVNTRAEAELAVRETRYPPLGRRGFGFSRANVYGAEFHDYAARANNEITLIVQIEHRDAIENLDAILSVPGIDGAMIGPMDLSGSFGKVADLECPEMAAALAAYLQACERWHIVPGTLIVFPTEDRVRAAVRDGYRFLALGVDATLLAGAAREALENARKGVTSI